MIPEPINTDERAREEGLAGPSPARERWRHFLTLVRTFWFGKDWKFAWAGSLANLALELGGVYILVWQNSWQQRLFDAVQYRQAGLFWTLVVSFCFVITLGVGTTIAGQYLYSMLAFRWRASLTERFMTRWLARHRYYEIERIRLIDNPDQRIAEDLSLFPTGVMPLVYGAITSTVTVVSFSIVLLKTAEPIHIALRGWGINIPGDTLWYTLLYAILGAVLVVVAGRPITRRTMRQQHYEANFRFALIHVRRNAEQIALSGAMPAEERTLREGFGELRSNFVRLVYAQLGLVGAKGVYGSFGQVLPLFIALPKYFARKISFGQVMSARDAFTQMLDALSFFTQSYQSIAELIASANRIKALDDAMDVQRERGIALEVGEGAGLTASGLAVVTPVGRPLVDVGDWTIASGERWVVQGPSGSGKSTLMRAMAGLWPDGRGTVSVGAGDVTMFVPQRLYLPLGTLKDAVCFPDRSQDHDDDVVAALLDRVHLGTHAASMHALRMWQDDLSPGEQQRIALARILLHKPSRLVLDEATSALDRENALHFYRSVLEALPGVTLISVVHAEHLVDFHTHCITIEGGKARQQRLVAAFQPA